MSGGLGFILRSDICPSEVSVEKFSFSNGARVDHTARGRSKHIIHLVLRGWREYSVNGRLFTVGENTVVYMPEGTRYLTVSRAADGSVCEGISVIFSLEGKTERSIPEDVYAVATGQKGTLREKMLSLYELERKKPTHALSRKRALLDLIEAFVVRLGGDERLSQAVYPAIEYMLEHYRDKDSVATYASLCNMSESYFRKLFAAATGMSPVDYRNSLRLSEAKRLYRAGKTMSEIAEELSFYDESYLAKLYRKKYGVSMKKDAEMV